MGAEGSAQAIRGFKFLVIFLVLNLGNAGQPRIRGRGHGVAGWLSGAPTRETAP